MTLQQSTLIIWAWRKLGLVVMALTILLTLLVSLVMPKTYTASTSIYIDLKPDPILGTTLPGMASMAYMATQGEIMHSKRVASRVAKILHIAEIPSVFEGWKEDTGGKISLEEYYGAILLKGLVVQPVQGTNIINLSFSAADPRFAAAAANAFAQATLDTNIELRVDPARAYAAWFDERLKTLRENLRNAQQKLSTFQKEQGIVATVERLDQENSRLESLNSALSATEAQRADITSREKNAGSELSPDVMQSALIQGLKADIAKAETTLGEITRTMGRNHPQRQQLEAHLVALRQQLAEEIARISGGVAAAGRVTSQKAMELRAAVEAQKKRVLELRAQHDQIDVLRQDVATAQRAYETVAQRMNQTTLESQSLQTNLSILSPAGEPTEASRPKILVNFLASVLVGLLLGVGATFGREFMDRRIRHRDDLVQLDGIPFLGVVHPTVRARFFKGRWATAIGWLAKHIWDRRRSTRLQPVL